MSGVLGDRLPIVELCITQVRHFGPSKRLVVAVSLAIWRPARIGIPPALSGGSSKVTHPRSESGGEPSFQKPHLMTGGGSNLPRALLHPAGLPRASLTRFLHPLASSLDQPLGLGPSPIGLKIDAYLAHALKGRRNMLWFGVDKADRQAHYRAFALTA